MATYTTNYNLKKPAATDNISVDDFNKNFDTIDNMNGYYSATFYMNGWIVKDGWYLSQTVNITGITAGFEYDWFYTEHGPDWNVNQQLAEGLLTIYNDGKFSTYWGDGILIWSYPSLTKPSIDIPIYFKRKVNK